MRIVKALIVFFVPLLFVVFIFYSNLKVVLFPSIPLTMMSAETGNSVPADPADINNAIVDAVSSSGERSIENATPLFEQYFWQYILPFLPEDTPRHVFCFNNDTIYSFGVFNQFLSTSTNEYGLPMGYDEHNGAIGGRLTIVPLEAGTSSMKEIDFYAKSGETNCKSVHISTFEAQYAISWQQRTNRIAAVNFTTQENILLQPSMDNKSTKLLGRLSYEVTFYLALAVFGIWWGFVLIFTSVMSYVLKKEWF